MTLRRTLLPTTAMLVLLTVALAGCTQPGGPGAIQEVTFGATDYAFTGPDTIEAGWTEVTIINEGSEPHHVQLARLDEGRTVAEFESALMGGEVPTWITLVGGPNAAMPGGGRAVSTQLLAPGTYVLYCEIPNATGVPHLFLGMVKGLTVTEAEGPDAEPPTADATLTLEDFRFDLDAPPAPGERTFRVVNEGGEPHEVAIGRLMGNATVQDLLQSLGPNATGPPPAVFLGGVVGLEVDGEAYFTAQMDAGERYALICFFHSEEHDAPHFALGMAQEFTVAAA